MSQESEEMFNNNDYVQPEIYPLHPEIEQIISIPLKNSIGTVDVQNAVTALELSNGEIHKHELRRDFLLDIKSDFKRIDWSYGDLIAGASLRYLWFFNVKTKLFQLQFIPAYNSAHFLDFWINSIAAFPPQELRFLFEIESGYETKLEAIQFDTASFDWLNKDNDDLEGNWKTTGEYKLDRAYTIKWAIKDGKILLGRCPRSSVRGSSLIEAYDYQFNKTEFPIIAAFEPYKDTFYRIGSMAMNPMLPIGLVEEVGSPGNESFCSIWLARWDFPDEGKRFFPICSPVGSLLPGIIPSKGGSGYLLDFAFSPDGRWIVFQSWGTPLAGHTPVFYAVPVDTTYPLYLGMPVLLGSIAREDAELKSTAWINDPLSYVACDGKVLYKWELGKLPRKPIPAQ